MTDPYAALVPKKGKAAENPYAALVPAQPKEKGFLDRVGDFFGGPTILPQELVDARERATAIQAQDVGQSDGLLDRGGDLLRRGFSAFQSGLYSAGAALQDINKIQLPGISDESHARNLAASEANKARLIELARQQDSVASTALPGEATFDQVKENPTDLATIGQFIAEQGVQSLPGMAAAVFTAPLYGYSLTGQIGQTRAENDGRDDIQLGDLVEAAPAAAASLLLERIGAKGITTAPAKTVVGRVAQAGAKEGATEFAQSGIEYTGGSLGTDAGFDVGEAIDQSLAGSLAGFGTGASLRGGGEVATGTARAAQAANDTRLGVQALSEAAQLAAPTVDPSQQLEPIAGSLDPEADPYASLVPSSEAVAPSPRVAPPRPAAGDTGATTVEPGRQEAQGQDIPEPTPTPVEPQAAPQAAKPAEPLPAVNTDPRPDPGEAGEGERIVRTPAGGRVRTRFEVVELGDLKQAEGANQNRDRSRDTTTLQVQDIISNFDPELLAEDPSSDRGAPIVGPDNAIDSGNGRTLTLAKIYEQYPEQAARYRAMIESRGHSTEGLSQPVLIQRRLTDFTPEQRRQFVIDSNKDTKLELSPVERARSDADNITAEMLARFAGGDLNSTANKGFVEAFTRNLTAGEMGNVIGDDRRLTTAGLKRLENAVVARAFDNPKLLEQMLESDQDDIRAITGSLAEVAPAWAGLREAVKAGELDSQYDVTDDLIAAAHRVSTARKKGEKPADILSQIDAFSGLSPIAEQFIRAFYNPELTRAASKKKVGDFLRDYVEQAQQQQATEGLFGAQDPVAPQDLLKQLLDTRDNPNGDGLFSEGANNDRSPQLERAPASVEEQSSRDSGAGAPARGKKRKARAALFSGASLAAFDTLDAPDASGTNYAQGRLPEGRYAPTFEQASFTNRTSNYAPAAELVGMDADKFQLLNPPRQLKLLRRAMDERFGIKVTVDKRLQDRFAIDQMLDALQNVQAMAHVLNLPASAMGFDGKLGLTFQKNAAYLGAYYPGLHAIALPKRSNSFAHEWGHALDYWLLDKTGEGEGKGLSGAIRQRGSKLSDGELPGTVREGFVDLLNAMFFDRAEQASIILDLEAKLAAATTDKQREKYQAQIDRIKDGASQTRRGRSQFYRNAKDFDGGQSGTDGYWTSPTEMFARAFEAYTSYKVEAAGLTTEFIGKGDANYLAGAEDRFEKTFPKGVERGRVFAAFDRLFGLIGDEKLLGPGTAAPTPEGFIRKITDFDKLPEVAKEEVSFFQREVRAYRQAADRAAVEKEGRANDKGKLEKTADLTGITFMSMAGQLRMIQRRSGSKALQQLTDLLTKQDGLGDRTVARTFAEDVTIQARKSRNRLTNILQANKADSLGKADTRLLRDLLIGEDPQVPDGKENIVKAAADIRRLLNEEFYVNQQAGIDLGYANNGYLSRTLDLPKVWHNQDGFVAKAAEVYEVVFDNEFGDVETILNDPDALKRFMKLTKALAKKGNDFPAMGEVQAALKVLKKASERGDAEAVKAAQEELAEAFGELVEQVKQPFAQDRAEAWLSAINLVAGEERNAPAPASKYTKARSLPPEADKIMEDFYLSDPVEAVANYLNASARRTAYVRRFGVDGKKRKALFEQMSKQGVTPEDQRMVEKILDKATGRSRLDIPRIGEEAAGFVSNAATMALLPRATLSSLAEQFTAGIVTGDARDGLRMMGNMAAQMIRTPDGKKRAELVRAMGIIESSGTAGVMEARYGQTWGNETRWDRYTSEMFKRTGLTALTRSQKTAAVGVGHAFLDNNAQQIVSGNARAKADAISLFRELGISDPEAFAKELLKRGGLPDVEELATPFGEEYTTAQLRFSKMVVQEPDALDRPYLAHNPVGRIVYGITGFSYSYWRNIIKRSAIMTRDIAKRNGGRVAALRVVGLLGAAALSFLTTTTVSTIREALLNPERWEKMEKEGTLVNTMAALGFSRTFSFGALDVFYQAFTGLKYQRDLANIPLGAGGGFVAQNAEKVAKPLVANSLKTNSAEYNAVQGAYSLGSPLISFGLARIPGGPVVQGATGVGMMYLTSPNARDKVATFVVGEKNGTIGADGQKVKSGPTAFDRVLLEYGAGDKEEDE